MCKHQKKVTAMALREVSKSKYGIMKSSKTTHPAATLKSKKENAPDTISKSMFNPSVN